MTASRRRTRKSPSSCELIKARCGVEVDLNRLPPDAISEEMRQNNSKHFWNELDKHAKNAAGITIRQWWSLQKTDRDELRSYVLEHYGCSNKTISRRWVYIITHPKFEGACKVGISNNVRQRLAQYQVGCPMRAYRLEFAREYQDISNTIDEVYRRLDGHRLKGEWFDLSAQEIIDVLTELFEERL